MRGVLLLLMLDGGGVLESRICVPRKGLCSSSRESLADGGGRRSSGCERLEFFGGVPAKAKVQRARSSLRRRSRRPRASAAASSVLAVLPRACCAFGNCLQPAQNAAQTDASQARPFCALSAAARLRCSNPGVGAGSGEARLPGVDKSLLRRESVLGVESQEALQQQLGFGAERLSERKLSGRNLLVELSAQTSERTKESPLRQDGRFFASVQQSVLSRDGKESEMERRVRWKGV